MKPYIMSYRFPVYMKIGSWIMRPMSYWTVRYLIFMMD